MKTVVALYDEIEDARDVVEDLVSAGIARSDISLIARDVEGRYGQQIGTDRDSGEHVGEAAAAGATGGAVLGGLAGVLVGLGAFAIPGIGPVIAAGPIVAGLTGAVAGAVAGGLLGALVEWGIPEEEAEYYAEGVRRGGTLVSVRVSDERADEVAEIMEDYGPVDVERRASYWQAEEGWAGYDSEAEPYDDQQIGAYHEGLQAWDDDYDDDMDLDVDDEETFDVVEEELRVGKRAVTGGGVRVHSHVITEPVEENVRLRREHVSVDRRQVDRPADDADFEEQSIEMTETYEEPVVEKRARVIEEVVVRKDTDVVDATIRDEVRRTEVDVDETGNGMDGGAFEDYDEEFRSHYNTNFGTTGYTYNQFSPAYRYGYTLAGEDRYRNTEWTSVEPVARRRWEEYNQGTWEEFKDAVRHGWQRAKDALS